MFQLGGERDGEVERGDAERRRFQRAEMFFRQLGHEFGAEAVGTPAFVQHDQAAGACEGGADGIERQGSQGAQIEKIEGRFVFGREIIARLIRQVHHLAVRHKRGEVARPHFPRLPDVAIVGIPDDRRPAPAVKRLVFEKDDRVVVLVGGENRVERVLRRAGVQRLQAGHRQEKRIEFLRVERAEGEPATGGKAQDERTRGAGTKMHRRGVQRDLGRGLGREVRKLKFLDGPVPVDREPDGVAGAGAFGEGRVQYAGPAEFLEQVLRHLEGPAVGADVLAEHDRLRALGEDFAEPEIEGLGDVELRRRRRFRFPRQGRGGRREQARGHAFSGGPRCGDGDFYAGLEKGGEFGIDGIERGGADRRFEPGAKTRHGIAGEETVAFPRLQVVAGIIRCVTPQAQHLRLDQNRARGAADFFDHRRERSHRQLGVGAIHPQALDPVAGGAFPELGARGELLARGRRVGIAVVLNHEHDGQ